MLKHPEISHRRVKSFIAELKGRLYGDSTPLSVEVNEHPAHGDKEALAGEWKPVTKGYAWGPAYNTRWFRVTGTVPKEFDGKILRVIADVGGERTVWRDGTPVFGVDHEHTDFGVLSGGPVLVSDKPVKAGEKIEVLIQAYARNPQVRVHGREPKREELVESVGRVEMITYNADLQGLIYDLEFRLGLLDALEKDSPHYALSLRSCNDVINDLQVLDKDSIAGARASLNEQTGENYAPPHRIVPVGHAHLDTAWLWPIEITKKKMAHTTATQLGLIDQSKWFVFAHSQASQYEWLEKEYPILFEKIKDQVKKKRWEPVGSMWVEADCNIPSGESLVRQFLYGRKYFRDKLGYETEDMFLPDVFGYSAALPQILHGFGIKYFLTQKISWNQSNKFPHNTFWWQGIDGTKVWSHFPPADTYIGSSEPAELMKSMKNHKDQGRSDMSLYLFGFGDGGGGPTQRHIELLERANDCHLLPSIQLNHTVRDFYRSAYEHSKDLATWSGELYLEFHRGTYTTQAAMKMLNRECEMLLRDAELLASFAYDAKTYPAEKIEEAWKKVLLNQFHDIIPGSSVHEVYVDAEEMYRQAYVAAYQVILDSIHASAPAGAKQGETNIALFKNSTVGGEAWVDEYHIDGKPPKSIVCGDQTLPVQFVKLNPIDDPEELGMLLFETPKAALGGIAVGQFNGGDTPTPYSRTATESQLESEDWIVKIDKNGNLSSVVCKTDGAEYLRPGEAANVFQLLDDRPLFWSAWDIDPFALETAKDLLAVDSIKVVETGPVRVAIEVTRSFSKSRIVQRISLGPTPGIRFDTEVDWHEEDKLLKVAFPVAINSTRASYEIQYGHVERATHYNTSWDQARFEVCAQKWVDLSEGNRGVALLNNCKYGHDIHESVIRLSLLRSPKAPDPECDMGVHRFTYVLLPHEGSLQEAGVVHKAYGLNVPVHHAYLTDSPSASASKMSAFAEVDSQNLIVESVKRAEDGNGLIVRMYECHNARGSANLRLARAIKSAKRCNLEEIDQESPDVRDGAISFDYKPFEIISFRVIV